MLWKAGIDILDGLEISDAPLTLPHFISLPPSMSLQTDKLIHVLESLPLKFHGSSSSFSCCISFSLGRGSSISLPKSFP